MNYKEKSLLAHQQRNVLRITPNVKVENRDDLSTYYTPGIAAVSESIRDNADLIYNYTIKRNSVAVVSDGSAVLGLGNIGPEAALPVMEGKCLLFSKFANIDAYPICLKTQEVDEIVEIVRNIATSFGGINLEDISAPRCFEIEERLQDMGIPVMHDDQHGTAVVVLAGLINALKITGKQFGGVKVVILGAGAAGTAIAKMILAYSGNQTQIVIADSRGSLCDMRRDLNVAKSELQRITNNTICGELGQIIRGADVFIGVSAPNVLSAEMVKSMAKDPIVFAMANPIPEIDPDLAKQAGARVVATGRSDYPNQINNVLAFPGIFRGALDARAKQISREMLLAAAISLADQVQNPTVDNIVPSPLDLSVATRIAKVVAETAAKSS
ncbi:MAG: NAD-dependent malic enzyme [bacterium ADurb.Bin400]|nr:MAG: NAD-dependent malic enzyme [bacterium ADurb.Bin400]